VPCPAFIQFATGLSSARCFHRDRASIGEN
jgi:hypothetical protein